MTAPVKPVEAPKPKTIEVHDMLAVHGRLNHPYTHVWFDTGKKVPHVLDAWCQGQIDADKLKIV
jgi:hypothetical protein